jgi:hypothetical protein
MTQIANLSIASLDMPSPMIVVLILALNLLKPPQPQELPLHLMEET